MERERAKLANESRVVETSDAIVESLRHLGLHDRRTNSDLLPVDLLMEILKRLPVKTLARFLCVSKLWASIIRRRDFMKLFLTSIRPARLFFSFRGDNNCFFFFSSLQPQKSGEASLATYHMTYAAYEYTINFSSVHGLVCYGNASASGLVVYNPATRRSITLPEFEPDSFVIRHFLSYDPIDGVYKVLCLTGQRLVYQMAEPKFVIQVLALGNENSWKTIEISRSHFPLMNHICIDGVLYYEAFDTVCQEAAVISFDVRSESFDLIKRPGDDNALSILHSYSTLIRYEGKLAIISKEISANGSIVLWVLEDALKHEWLKKTFVLPSSWTSLAQGTSTSSHEFHRFFNVTDAGELILAPVFLLVPPFYVLYYDPKRKSVRKVEIEGATEHKLLNTLQACLPTYLFSSQVESLMFL